MIQILFHLISVLTCHVRISEDVIINSLISEHTVVLKLSTILQPKVCEQRPRLYIKLWQMYQPCTTMTRVVHRHYYCFCQLWFNSTKSSLKKLSTSYNSVLRRLLGICKPYSASQMFVFRGIPTFVELLRTSIYRFAQRIEYS